MTQTEPASEPVLRLHDGRRADSLRVIRKFALSAAVAVAAPGTEPAEVVAAARLFACYLLTEEAQP
jgi:hypothetical protein